MSVRKCEYHARGAWCSHACPACDTRMRSRQVQALRTRLRNTDRLMRTPA